MSPSTHVGDFYGSPVQADQASIPRKYVRTTDASTAYWREEVQTVSTAAGGAGSTDVTAKQGIGSSVSPWFVAPLTTASLVRVQDLTTASIVRSELTNQSTSVTIAPLTTASKTKAEIDALTTASVVRAELTNQSTNFNSTVFQGTSPWIIGGNTTALITTASKVLAELTNQTTNVTVAPLTTASKVQVEGNTTAVITTASKILAQIDALTTASVVRAELTNESTNVTVAALTTVSKVQMEGVFSSAGIAIYGQTTDLGSSRIPVGVTTLGEMKVSGSFAGSSHTTVFQGTSPWVVAGNTTAVITTASKIVIDALTSASKVRIESDGSFLPVLVSTVQFKTADFNTSAGTIETRVAVGLMVPTLAGAEVLGTTAGIPVTPGTGTTFQTRPMAQPLGEFTLETGTTAHSTFAGKVSSVAGTTSLITSGTGRVRVLSLAIQQSDTASTVSQLVQFLSGTTVIPGAPEWLLSQREGVVQVAPTGGYLFQTDTGGALQISLSTNVKVMVHVTAIRTT